MKNQYWRKLAILLAMAALVAGCQGSGSSSASAGGAFIASVTTTQQPPTNETTVSSEEIAVVHNPEPGSLALLGLGFAGLTLMRRKKR
ncbi:MAG: PEP-CTERM sorting domain-containing protein [Deltaproteobacteria bacterium]